MFLIKIVASIGCTFVLFLFAEMNQPKHKHALSISRYPGVYKERNITNKRFKNKFYMHNTIGDAVLMNISQETNYHV